MEIEVKKEQDSEAIRLDRKSKILFTFFGILIVGSVMATYWRYMIRHDYIIRAKIDCDPEKENCFVWKCDPMSFDEGKKCTGVPENDIWYYKILNRNAKNIPNCDPKDENCTAYICGEGETDCSEELCTPENVPEGESCNDPKQYLLENPLEEEKEECAEGDEECLARKENASCEESDEECTADEGKSDGTEKESLINEDNSEEANPDNQSSPPGGN